MRAHRRGMSLIELTVSLTAFTAVMVVGFGLMVLGTQTWNTVQSRSDVERDGRLAINDMTRELSRALATTAATVAVSTTPGDYRWALWFQTNMNQSGSTPQSLGDPVQAVVDNGGTPQAQRYVLYYVARMDPGEHVQRYGFLCGSYPGGSSPDPGAGPDALCPHKWLIKKEIYLYSGNHDPGNPNNSDNIGPQGGASTSANLATFLSDATRTEKGIAAEGEASSPGSQVHTARVLAQDVVSFEVSRLSYASGLGQPAVLDSAGNVILVHLRLFKVDQVSRTMRIGQTPLYSGGVPPSAGQPQVPVDLAVTPPHMASTPDPSMQPYTIDLETQVVPRN
ncbi:MAG: PilW family protein [Candidatus Xenobia bacterium]